jgi:hypothetical protein
MSLAVLTIVVASAVLAGTAHCALRLKYQGRTVTLPMRLFYIEERRRLDQLIRWTRWPGLAIALLTTIGFGFYVAGGHPSTWLETSVLALALSVFPLVYPIAHRKLAELHALRERVDRNLRELERGCNRKPDCGDHGDSQVNGP